MESDSSRPSSPDNEDADAASPAPSFTAIPGLPIFGDQEPPQLPPAWLASRLASFRLASSEAGSEASSSTTRTTTSSCSISRPKSQPDPPSSPSSPSSHQSTSPEDPTSTGLPGPLLSEPEVAPSDSSSKLIPLEQLNLGIEYINSQGPDGPDEGVWLYRMKPSMRAIASSTCPPAAINKEERAKRIPDEELVAMEVHGRCRFMWDTRGFERDAPRESILSPSLYDDISGFAGANGFFIDAAYVGYSMYCDGPVFAEPCHGQSGCVCHDDSDGYCAGWEHYIEPGHKYVHMEVIPHCDIATRANSEASHSWARGVPAEDVFGKLMPLGYVMQQARKNATDLAEGRGPIPVTRVYALDYRKLVEEAKPERLLFPDEKRGFDNPCLAEVVYDARSLARGCNTSSTSMYRYAVPCTGMLEYPDPLLHMLSSFATKYKKDRLTEKGLLLAAHLWVNITNDPGFQLEVLAQHQRQRGLPYRPVPAISLAQCLIYYPHWLRWVANMGLVEFIHPFRFIHKAVETDLANNPDARMEVEAHDIDEHLVRELMDGVRSIAPEILTPADRYFYFPYSLPGSTLPGLSYLKGEPGRFFTAVSGLEHVRFLGFPSYARPRADQGVSSPSTFVLVQPKWATRRVLAQDCVKPYLEYREANPEYPGYGFVKKWARPAWRDLAVKVRADWQWW